MLIWSSLKRYACGLHESGRAAGETIRTALIQANHARLRPILMTTIAMVFGMFLLH
jgi:multidrug efflux pump subunit AcrB